MGQLVYVLALNGFDAKHGKFIQYGQSICAFVRKTNRPLPPLHRDRGDIHILGENDFFPVKISSDRGDDNFCGNILCINWDNPNEFFEERAPSAKRRIALFLSSAFPREIRPWLGDFFLRAARIM